MVKYTTECPYNPEHKMRYTRLIYHLAKGCPDMSDDYEICAYNWVHRVPRGTLESHYLECDCKPVVTEYQWSSDIDMDWRSNDWNHFLYEKDWPPVFFPDY